MGVGLALSHADDAPLPSHRLSDVSFIVGELTRAHALVGRVGLEPTSVSPTLRMIRPMSVAADMCGSIKPPCLGS